MSSVCPSLLKRAIYGAGVSNLFDAGQCPCKQIADTKIIMFSSQVNFSNWIANVELFVELFWEKRIWRWWYKPKSCSQPETKLNRTFNTENLWNIFQNQYRLAAIGTQVKLIIWFPCLFNGYQMYRIAGNIIETSRIQTIFSTPLRKKTIREKPAVWWDPQVLASSRQVPVIESVERLSTLTWNSS